MVAPANDTMLGIDIGRYRLTRLLGEGGMGRVYLPDAKLTRFDFDPVYSDGHVDLTATGRDRQYELRSPSKSMHPANVPPNVPVELGCKVIVDVGATEDCDDKLVRHPRCHFAGVWKQAVGTPTTWVARIAWLSDEQWFFDTDLAGKGGGVSSFPDRCP